MLDIDHFKSINDRYGHDGGDRVINAVADVLPRNKRSSDIAGRIGGEEFAHAAARNDLAEACAAAERLRKTVAERSIDARWRSAAGDGQRRRRRGASATSHGIPDLIKQADSALYEAKRTGRNRICVSGAGDAGSATAA